jgi:hypothetical protein
MMLATIQSEKYKIAPPLSRKNQVRAQNKKGKAMKNMLGNLMCAMWPNDPKLSHGANNCKRESAMKRKMKEQSPLAPARC